MKNLLLTIFVVPFLIAGCGSSADDSTAGATGTTGTTGTAAGTTGTTGGESGQTADQLVGMWKVDMAASQLDGFSDKEKQDAEILSIDLQSGGVVKVKLGDKEESGTWKLDGKNVVFEGTNEVPTPMALSDDGKQMSYSMEEGGKTVTIVMSKG